MPEHTHSPFKDRTSLTEARGRLGDRVDPHGRTETVEFERADGRLVATAITAQRNVPHYQRAAMDGYAVHAEDTFGAGDRSPAILQSTDDAVEPGTARQVHTGSELPDGADAVVMTERVTEVGDELEVFDTVGEGENVAPVGEDVAAGQELYEPGERLTPSDLGLLKSVGMTDVSVVERPDVCVIPTGEELVQSDPDPGEIIETNGLTVSGLVERWGGDPTYCDVVTDDKEKLTEAIEDGLSADVVVTTGGSSVGARDLLPEVVSDLGEVFVHGVGIKPGHPVALGEVEGTPVLILPGYPVSCLINAVQFLRPTLAWLQGTEPEPFPTVTARLDEKIHSEPGIRSFARVQLEADDAGQEANYVASAVRASGAGVLSSVSLSDGWVVVPEESEGIEQDQQVAVQRWEWSP
jgi:molybdopterin molybdotransferase